MNISSFIDSSAGPAALAIVFLALIFWARQRSAQRRNDAIEAS